MKLAVQNISVKLDGKEILTDIAAKFPEGKRTAVIGRNGAGKSTLLKVLANLNENYDGAVLLDGVDIKTLPRKKIARRIAFLPQATTAPLDLTVEELADFGRFPYRSVFGKSTSHDKEAVEHALADTGLSSFRKRRLGSLSGGEKQRAHLAMALAQEPQILLLDEPTTYLDIAHQLEVMRIVAKIADTKGITVIMVLHDMTHALQYADEVLVIKDHGIFAQGVPRKILTADLIETVFGVNADTFTNKRGVSVILPCDP